VSLALLFQLALDDVPVAFDFECGHDGLFCLLFVFIRRERDGKSVPAASWVSGCKVTGSNPPPVSPLPA
jgi:hypothetical protein